jgi:hypothetical protein
MIEQANLHCLAPHLVIGHHPCGYAVSMAALRMVVASRSRLPRITWYNNYEMAPKDGQIVLPQTGTYKIVVRRYKFDDADNYLAVAWIKDATYLPELRNRNDWVSSFYALVAEKRGYPIEMSLI